MKALIAIVVAVILCYVAYHTLPRSVIDSITKHGSRIVFFAAVALVLAMIAYFTPINPYFQP